ncbi:MAG: metal-dependent hydrolase [Sphingobacteriia bacterium]|nr:metal-dependent hydrolase [Sphingobacteriia bacterium]NCC39332.1 metal-dependent hydrolase [Gammaproteobacteria bacterium]
MANFQTHLNVGIFISGATVLWLQGAGLTDDPTTTLVFFALGVAGSLLPDIDADASKPVRAFFNLLGVAVAFAVTLPLAGRLLPLDLALLWGGLFILVRYLVFEIFSRLTIHRGIWHSWLAVAATTLATVDLAYWVLDRPPTTAWLAGLMVGIGYVTHLCLDELFSVDLLNSRVKRSFGSALKILSLTNPLSSLAMLALVLALAWLAPSLEDGLPVVTALAHALIGLADPLHDSLVQARDWILFW